MTSVTDLEPNEAAALEALIDAAVFASKPRKHREIAARLGISRERVRQLQNQALAKLAKRLSRSDWLEQTTLTNTTIKPTTLENA